MSLQIAAFIMPITDTLLAFSSHFQIGLFSFQYNFQFHITYYNYLIIWSYTKIDVYVGATKSKNPNQNCDNYMIIIIITGKRNEEKKITKRKMKWNEIYSIPDKKLLWLLPSFWNNYNLQEFFHIYDGIFIILCFSSSILLYKNFNSVKFSNLISLGIIYFDFISSIKIAAQYI